MNSTDELLSLQNRLRLDPPLKWERWPLEDLHSRMEDDRELMLDVIDYLLAFRATPTHARELSEILADGGSAWETTPIPNHPQGKPGGYQLTAREIGPVREGIDEIPAERARHHLAVAWSKVMGRDPDPSTAYREAIRAIEAVAKPVISPDNPKATLGTMIADIRNKPEKWTIVLERGSMEGVADQLEMLWTSQLDRHGTDDESVPLTVTQEQADAAVHLAIGLARLFAGGLIQRV